MDTIAKGFPYGDLRVSDADRDRAIAELSEAFQAGRITAEEFDERSGKALTARTGKELAALLADLPRREAAATGGAGSGRLCPGPRDRVPARRAGAPIAAVAVLVVAFVATAVGGHGHAGLAPGVIPVLVVALIAFRRLSRRRS